MLNLLDSWGFNLRAIFRIIFGFVFLGWILSPKSLLARDLVVSIFQLSSGSYGVSIPAEAKAQTLSLGLLKDNGTGFFWVYEMNDQGWRDHLLKFPFQREIRVKIPIEIVEDIAKDLLVALSEGRNAKTFDPERFFKIPGSGEVRYAPFADLDTLHKSLTQSGLLVAAIFIVFNLPSWGWSPSQDQVQIPEAIGAAVRAGTMIFGPMIFWLAALHSKKLGAKIARAYSQVFLRNRSLAFLGAALTTGGASFGLGHCATLMAKILAFQLPLP